MALLEVQNLEVFYGRIQAIKGISFSVNEGEIVTLIGANGAGKTTTMKTMSGVRPVAVGSITFDGQDITKMPPHKRRQPLRILNVYLPCSLGCVNASTKPAAQCQVANNRCWPSVVR
jgi:ABC-type branched-subunit amino acid transport system ATPase component